MAPTPSKCPSCGGQNLTKPGRMEASSHTLHRQFAIDDGSWLGSSVLVHVQGVICADCGHVAMFADPDDLGKLRENWQRLK